MKFKYLTPEILREAQTYLWDGTLESRNNWIYLCIIIELNFGYRVQREFFAVLIAQNAVDVHGEYKTPGPLIFSPDMSYKERQAVRFMLLELTALMLEDTAL